MRPVKHLAFCAMVALGFATTAWSVPGRAAWQDPLPGTAGLLEAGAPASLSPSRPEAPRSPLPDPGPETCVICRLARQTTGSLPPGSFTLAPEIAADGAVVRVAAADPTVRAALWEAMQAREELLAALRGGAPLPLCERCAMRRTWLAEVETHAERTAFGLRLAYASHNPEIVQHLHALVRGYQSASVRF